MTTDRKTRNPKIVSRLLLGALIVNLGLGLSYVGFWTIAAKQDMFWRADFSAFYTGWAIIRDGHGAQLYDLGLQTQYQQQILQGRSFKDGLLPYVNPPHLTLPFVPVSRLPLSTAYLIWTLGQVLLLIWLLYLLYDLARAWEPHERWLLLSAVLAFSPLMLTFMTGAFSLFLTICFLQFFLALKNGQDERAGLWLVLGTIKPQAVLIPGVILLAARRWRALLSALLIGGTVVLISTLVLGWQTWPNYVRVLLPYSGLFDAFGVAPAVMHNLKGTLTLILGNDQASRINLISYTALIAVTALPLWLWNRRWQPDEATFQLWMAFTLMSGLLFSIHLNPHDSLMFIVPVTLFYSYLRERNLPRRAFATFVLICPAVIFISEFTVRGKLGIRAPVLVMLVLASWMGKALYNEYRKQRVSLRLPGCQNAL